MVWRAEERTAGKEWSKMLIGMLAALWVKQTFLSRNRSASGGYSYEAVMGE